MPVRPRLRTAVQVAVGVVVSAICLWLAIEQAPLDEIAAVWGTVNFWLLTPVVVANILTVVARAYRWRLLLGKRGTVSAYFWAQAAGLMLTNVLPLRAGEAGRVVILSRCVGLPLVQVGTSVIVERALDLAVILALLGLLLLTMEVPWPVRATGLALGLALGCVCLGAVAALMFESRLSRRAEWVRSWLPASVAQRGAQAWSQMVAGLEPIRGARTMAGVVAWSVAIWVVSIVGFWASIEAVVPGANLIEPSFALTAVALGVALPSSPGFLGVYQLVGQQALVLPFPDRYTATSALLIVVLNHAAYYFTTTPLGMFGLGRLGFSVKSARALASSERATAPAAAGSAG